MGTSRKDIQPFNINVMPVHFQEIEWAFYQEEARKAHSRNLFSSTYDSLRALCCHPACNSKWMKRIRDENSSKFKTISLDQLRSRMVNWKKDDVLENERQIEVERNRIQIAINTFALIRDCHENFSFSKSELRVIQAISCEELISESFRQKMAQSMGADSSISLAEALKYYDVDRSLPIRLKNESGAFYHEENSNRACKVVKAMNREAIIRLIDMTGSFLRSCKQRITEKTSEIHEATRQAQYFDNMLELEGSDKRSSTCFICTESVHLVGVTPCKHAACLDCLISWVGQNFNCPTCRAITQPQKIVSVDLRASSAMEVKPSNVNVSDEVRKYGSKPAAVLAYCKALLEDPEVKILIFSCYNESLLVMSTIFEDEKIKNIACGLKDEKLAESFDRFKKSTTTRVLLMNSQISAAGTNLQEANYVIFLEPAGVNKSDALTIETQAVGRTCRLGQLRTVQVVYFIMQDTVEAKICDLLTEARESQKEGVTQALKSSPVITSPFFAKDSLSSMRSSSSLESGVAPLATIHVSPDSITAALGSDLSSQKNFSSNDTDLADALSAANSVLESPLIVKKRKNKGSSQSVGSCTTTTVGQQRPTIPGSSSVTYKVQRIDEHKTIVVIDDD